MASIIDKVKSVFSRKGSEDGQPLDKEAVAARKQEQHQRVAAEREAARIKREQERKKAKETKVEQDRIYAETLAKARKEKENIPPAPLDSYVSLQHINKIYGNHVQAVYDSNIEIKKNEFIVLVGPSGCGKSTTLRMIAGLEDITSGYLYIDGQFANDLPPKDRNIAMVFQNYALYPNMNVYQNIAFSLQVQHMDKVEIDRRVRAAAELLNITEYLDRKPKALSGGQQQRVALGRAIVRNAKVMLFDEPLSNLDAQLRVKMRSEIVRIHNQLHTTSIYVTHDQTEAMTMATRIVVMSKGHIQQIGAPKEIYNHPANTFVATFIGSPSMNLFHAKYHQGKITLSDGSEIVLPESFARAHDEFYKTHTAEALKYFDDYVDGLREKASTDQHLVISDAADPEAVKKKFSAAVAYVLKDKGQKEGMDYSEETKKAQDEYAAIDDPVANKARVEEVLRELYTGVNYKYDQHIMTELKTRIYCNTFYQSLSDDKPHEIIFGIRPEDIFVDEAYHGSESRSQAFPLKVSIAELLGNEYYLHTSFEGVDMVSKAPAGNYYGPGSDVNLVFDLSKAHIFDPASMKTII